MREELDKELCAKYPEIFKDRHGDKMKTCMCWGFPGDGWFNIIDRLCGKIMKVCRWAKVDPPVAVQVKEKFGALRFYLGPMDNEISSVIDAVVWQAENESSHTCEDCGKYGRLRGDGWLVTLCYDCAKKNNKKVEDWEEKSFQNKKKIDDEIARDQQKSAAEARKGTEPTDLLE